MKRKFLIQTMVVVVSTFYMIGYSFADETKNEGSMKNHKTIRIKEKEGIIPQTVTVTPGETVKWVNLSLSEVEIHFPNKEVIDAADCPVHFFICREGTYESHKICAGCTASLRFQEKGNFQYLVKESRAYHGDEKEFRGVMLIK